MKLRVWGLVVLIVAFKPGCVLAQTTAPLVSTPAPQQASSVIKKPRSVFLDIPILPMRKTVHISRIRSGNLNLGPILEPWGKNVIYRINFAPEISVASSENRLSVVGGLARAYDDGRRRNDNFLDVTIDQRIWNFSAGLNSFVEGEDVNNIFEVVDLTADFSRLSLGARGWSGIKVGSFSGNFLTLNVGGGYVKTRGDVRYYHPVIKDIDPVTFYQEGFRIYTMTAEGRKVNRRFSLHGKIDGVRYDGSVNTFNDLNAQGTIEVVPLVRFSDIHVLVKGSSNFQKYDSLLFRTGDPEIQIYLRIKIR